MDASTNKAFCTLATFRYQGEMNARRFNILNNEEREGILRLLHWAATNRVVVQFRRIPKEETTTEFYVPNQGKTPIKDFAELAALLNQKH